MATKKKKLSQLTWKEKLALGKPLSPLEDVQAEADFSVRRHLREQRERQEFDARKNSRFSPETETVSVEQSEPFEDETLNDEEVE